MKKFVKFEFLIYVLKKHQLQIAKQKEPQNVVEYINSRRKGRSDIGDLNSYDIHGNEISITSDDDEGNASGQFFSSVFTNETQTTQDINSTYVGSTNNIYFTEHYILTKLDKSLRCRLSLTDRLDAEAQEQRMLNIPYRFI